MNRFRKNRSSGFMLLDLAVIAALILLVVMIQISIVHRNHVFKEEKQSRKQMKWIAKAQELYYAEHGQYTVRFRDLSVYLRNVETFVCPTSGELYRLEIDDVGRYTLESPAGHGSILSGDPDWSE